MQPKRLIGIKGGTFDPIHYGHLRPALEVMQALGLDQVRFVPVNDPVHRNPPIANAQQRSEMIRLAIAHQPKFELDTVEIDRGDLSYTVDTLHELSHRYSDCALVLIMGTDAFAKFHEWKHWEGILETANIAITHRPGEPLPQVGKAGAILSRYGVPSLTHTHGQIVDVTVTQLDLSSTALRAILKRGDSADYLLPPAVIKFIEEHQLYQ